SSAARFVPPSAPPASITTTLRTWGEMSVSSAIAWEASTSPSILTSCSARSPQVLRRPRHASGGDDRLLRPPLVRPAALPRARAARAGAPGGRGVVLRAPALEDVSEHVARRDPARGAGDPEERRRTRDRRRSVPALVVALAVQRARERVQHRLRPAEPRLPAREGARHADDGRVARRALRLPGDRVDRAGDPQALPRLLRQPAARARRRDRDLDLRAVRLPRLRVLRAHERRPDPARGAPGCGHRRRDSGGDLPGAPGLRRHLEAQPGAADAVRPRDPARLALRDGERDRARGRGELVAFRARGALGPALAQAADCVA